MVACKIQLKANNKSLIVLSAYRPPNRDLDYVNDLCGVICDLVNKHSNSTVWIGGDLNLPDIDWSSGTVTSHNYPVSLSEHVIDTFSTVGLFQTVN